MKISPSNPFIFACLFSAILLAPVPLHAYHVGPALGLDKMAAQADLVCKARVIGTSLITNAAFRDLRGFQVQADMLEIISVLKGDPGTNRVLFQHYASARRKGFGQYSPQSYDLELGESYLIFAGRTENPGEFRQLHDSHSGKEDEGAMRTLDARPITGVSIKEAHWHELNLLLTNRFAADPVYAIKQLDAMSVICPADKGQFGTVWDHANDFRRDLVLNVLRPLLIHPNDEIALAALGCFRAKEGCLTYPASTVVELLRIANTSPSIPRRIAAIRALSDVSILELKNDLPHWLGDPSPELRAQAVLLLASYPGSDSERALRERAADDSPKVRVAVAETIGNGKFEHLLPVLVKLFSETNGVRTADVHGSAGDALLKFEINQVSTILKSHLGDAAFRLPFLCKLAKSDSGPWLSDLTAALEARHENFLNDFEANHPGSKRGDPRFENTISGIFYEIWNIIYDSLEKMPDEAFLNDWLNRQLVALENAGTTGSSEPGKLYKLYRLKGLEERAIKYRKECQRTFSYDIDYYFKLVDTEITRASQKAAR